jgi:hypothetical protein
MLLRVTMQPPLLSYTSLRHTTGHAAERQMPHPSSQGPTACRQHNHTRTRRLRNKQLPAAHTACTLLFKHKHSASDAGILLHRQYQ